MIDSKIKPKLSNRMDGDSDKREHKEKRAWEVKPEVVTWFETTKLDNG